MGRIYLLVFILILSGFSGVPARADDSAAVPMNHRFSQDRYPETSIKLDSIITINGMERRLLDEVDAISSVSGGSFTAAYFGLFGDRIFEDFETMEILRV